MTTTTRRDDLPSMPTAEVARQQMIHRATLAGYAKRPALASDLRQDATAQPRLVSASAARDAMIARSR